VLLPAAVGLAFLAYGAWQLQSASREAERLRAEAQQYADQVAGLKLEVDARTQTIEALQGEIRALEDKLQQTTQLSRYLHPIDFVDQKSIYSMDPRSAPVLGTVLELRERGVFWRLGGTLPEQGFDSPSFAAYVLERHGALPSGGSHAGTELLPRSRRLFESLPHVDEPRSGDLVFYPSGYVLFWFVDQRRQPFVIGMTPSGIVALEPDFAQRIGVGRPEYR
jgi:cell wall-associated NlpC family hydrolase